MHRVHTAQLLFRTARAGVCAGLFRAAILFAASILAASAPRAFAQTPQTPPGPASAQSATSGQQQSVPGFEIRQTVRRVVVDVVVTDAQDRPVAGLQAGNFKVYEDGHAQTIRAFDVHGSSGAPLVPPRPPALPPHTFINLPATNERGPLTVLLYDMLNTPLDAQLSAHQEIVNFLKSNPASSQTAIFALSDQLHLLQGFTDNREALLAAVNSKSAGPHPSSSLQSADAADQTAQDLADAGGSAGASSGAGRGRPSGSQSFDPTHSPASVDDMLARAESLEASALLDRRVDETLEALDQIARFLSAVPGRKNFIWLAGSFPINIAPDPDAPFNGNDLIRNYEEKIRQTADLLNTSHVAVYPVDIRGLIVNPMYSAASRRTYAPGGGGASHMPPDAKAVQDFTNQQTSEHATMNLIGERTGGRAFYNTNALNSAMQSAVADGSNYYSLEYAPTNDRYDGSLRQIKLTVDRPGAHLAYRRSYFAEDADDAADSASGATDREAVLNSLLASMQFGAPLAHELLFVAHVDAVGAPAPATPDQMKELAPYFEKAARTSLRKFAAPQTPVELQRYAVRYAVFARQLDLHPGADNLYRPGLTFAILAFDADGNTLAGVQKSIQDAIPAGRIGDIENNGYRTLLLIDAPANAASMRLAVRDASTGHVGTMELRLPLPPAPPQSSAAPATASKP
jgi:VWFA-related protein